MQASVRQSGNATIVDVVGDIDLENSPRLRKTLLEALRQAPRVIVNLQQVGYIDSSGIASLVEGLKESQTRKTRFILFGLSKAAREVFRLTRLIHVFEVYETEEQALAA